MHLIANSTWITTLAAALIFSRLAVAATHTWNGASPNSSNWSDAQNWSGGPPASNATTDVLFSSAGLNGASSPSSLQDFTTTSSFLLQSMTFSLPGTSLFTLAGGNIAFGGTRLLTQSSTAPVTISNNLVAQATSGGVSNFTILGDGVGLLTLSGRISTNSSGLGLLKQGNSTVLFTGASQLAHVIVEGGVVRNTGAHTLSRFASIASMTSAPAHYELQAGSFSAALGTTVGGTGPGTFDQIGGAHSGGGLTVASGGTYNLSGGTMFGSTTVKEGGAWVQTGGSSSMAPLTVESGGAVNISGGTSDASNTTLGSATGSAASFSVTNTGVASLGDAMLGATASVEVRSGGRLTVRSGACSASSSILVSNAQFGGNALIVGTASGPHSFTFAGVIANGSSGPGGVNCVGQGQTVFHALNTYTGATNVSTGLIAGNGRIAGAVNLTSGATISPGNFIPAPPGLTDAGTFQVGSLMMSQGTTYNVQLNGPAAGQYDILHVDGAANVSAGPTLSVDLGYTALPGQTFTIINVAGGAANPIVGHFANAADNTVMSSSGHSPTAPPHYYYVDYQGGDGNDLTLTVLDPLVVSRKLHGDVVFDAIVASVEPAATECRSGGANRDFRLIFNFNDPLVSVGNAQLVSGVGSVSSHGIGADPRQYIVNLTGVNNLQRIIVVLSNVNDAAGHSFSSISRTVRMLLGDTNGDGAVNSGDALQTRNRSGQAADAANFRSDVNCDGSINSGDALVVRSRSGNSVP